MRGICGYVRLDGSPAEDALARRMAGVLVQAGIGEVAVHCEGPVALAGVAWSISGAVNAAACLAIDSSLGLGIVAEARLGRRKVLAAKLGVSADLGDAELILQAWLQWGQDAARHLEGDFAFVAWDQRSHRVFCVRDRVGVKPLYLHYRPGRLLAFASSSSALLALPDVPTTLNDSRIADVLVQQLEGIDKTSTFYQAIERMPPAHVLAVRAGGVERQRYWLLEPASDSRLLPRSDREWAEAFRDVVQRAVADHLDSGGRLGCMLSGGLDSSTLAVLARDHQRETGRGSLMTFSSVDRGRPGCAETTAIDAVLAQPGFLPVVTDAAELEALAPRLRALAWGSPEPFDFMMALIHVQCLQAAARGLDGLIDGGDGDTLLGEGNALARALLGGHWLRAWRNAGALAPVQGARSVQLLKAAVVCSHSLLLPGGVRHRLQRAWDARRAALAIRDTAISPAFAKRVNLPARLSAFGGLRSRLLLRDAAVESAEALDHPFTASALERYHRVGAAHGIELRTPLLDRDVLELCVNLPDWQRVGRDSKLVLRRALHGTLPEPVLARHDKSHLGFAMNVRWVLQRGAVARTLEQAKSLAEPYLDLAKVDRLLSGWLATPSPAAPGPALIGALAVSCWLLNASSRDAPRP
jgi:asparagine synthase (glutamine-hydrolysing)